MTESTLAALGATEVYDLPSRESEETYRIFVGHCGPEPVATLYVTDGNGYFGMAVDAIRLMQIPALMPSLLVVAIGYPGFATLPETVDIRPRDLTPTVSSRFPLSGGADQFLRFLRDDLFPWVEDRYLRAASDRIYFGHSLGGLFGAHVLLADPTTFDRYIISSPSLWWNRRVLFEREEQYAAGHDDLKARVFVGIGADETDDGRRREAVNLPAGHPAKPPALYLDMVDDVLQFTAALRSRNYPSLDLACAVYPDEFHATVPPLVLTRGLRHFFPAPSSY
jgi:predicted alpha/beta superfamily hydrolase